MATELKRMKQLIGSTADWAANDIALLDGEIGVENRADGSKVIKIGDGVTVWSLLPAFGVPVGSIEGSILYWDNTGMEWGESDTISINANGQLQNDAIAPSYVLRETDNANYTWVIQLQSGDLRFYDLSNLDDRMIIKTDGGVTVGQELAYAGQGVGTIDVTGGYYINGAAVPTRAEFDALEARVTVLETP